MVTYYDVGEGKTYSTIQSAIDDIPGDLSSGGGGVRMVRVYADSVTGNVYAENLNGYTGFTNESAVNYIHYVAMVNHNGKSQAAGGTGIKVSVSAGPTAHFYVLEYSIVDGFEFTGTPTNGNCYLILTYGNCVIRNSIVHDWGDAQALYRAAIALTNSVAYNNIVYNISSGRNSNPGCVAIYGGSTSTSASCVNNTIYDITCSGTGNGYGWYNAVNNDAHVIYNTYAGSCDVDIFINTKTKHDYNVSSDATATGPNSQTNKAAVNQFVSVTAGSENFNLASNAVDIYGAGLAAHQLSATDAVGNTWEDPPSVGALELAGGINCKVSGAFGTYPINCKISGAFTAVPLNVKGVDF